MRAVALGVAAGLVAIQLVPVERTNPPVTGEIGPPPEVHALLRRACYDCHSHATVWPWYARVAPVSWLIAYDVREAREHLDFSAWTALPAAKRAKKLGQAAEEVGEGDMPLWYYLPLHPEARLTDDERRQLVAWFEAERALVAR